MYAGVALKLSLTEVSHVSIRSWSSWFWHLGFITFAQRIVGISAPLGQEGRGGGLNQA